jgi:hypothetical protein
MAVRHLLMPPALFALALLAGCQGANLNPQPGPHIALDTLRPTADFYERVDKPLVQSNASIAGLSRDNWAPVAFSVPVSGVEHKPIYTDDKPQRTDSTARQRGEFPTQASAAQNSDDASLGDQAAEAALAPVRAGWDILWMVPKMIATPPGRTVSSPRVAYERSSHASGRENGGLRSAGLGVSLLPLNPQQAPAATTPAGEPAVAPPPGAPMVPPPVVPAPLPGEPPQPGAPVPPTTDPNAPPPPPPGLTPAPRLPGGAIGGSDSPKRREQSKPRPPATDPEKKP